MPHKLIKIVITGPESTGKSTLAVDLANHYKCAWVPEFAREYLTVLKEAYSITDMDKMSRGQLRLEDQIASESADDPFVFIDTDLITYKIWYMHKFGKVPNWIETAINTRKYDHYLLCAPDLPWEYDVLRENPNMGEFFFEWYQKELKNYGKDFTIIRGEHNKRVELAKTALLQEFENL